MMPEMDGPTTLTQLRKNPQTCAIPVVFMTAHAQTREVEHFIALGAQGVISKPFDPMTLAVTVQRRLPGASLHLSGRTHRRAWRHERNEFPAAVLSRITRCRARARARGVNLSQRAIRAGCRRAA